MAKAINGTTGRLKDRESKTLRTEGQHPSSAV